MNYKAEIDGLRALSILGVILFHINQDIFSGGFIGVDIFFLISGYLITKIIITDYSKHLVSNEEATKSVINWLCKQTKTIKYIRSLHKKTKCRFTQDNLTNAMNNTRENTALIQYLLENSTRDEIKVTKQVIEKGMENLRPPKIVGVLLHFLK